MIRNITVGIDVGTHTTRVIVGEYRVGDPRPVILGMGSAESRGMRHGYVVNRAEAIIGVGQALKEAERASKVKIRRAFASVGGVSLDSGTSVGAVAITKNEGVVTELDMRRALKESEGLLGVLPNRKVLHTIPVKWKLDGKEVWGRSAGLKGEKLEVKTLFVTCLEHHLNDLVEVIEENGVEVVDVVASPLAASLVSLTKRQKTAGCVLVNIGAETVSMVVYENDTPVFLHVFPLGGTDITNDIALGLKIPLEEAESVKTGSLQGASYPKKKLDEIIEARLEDIFELVETYLKKIGRNGLLPAGIVLTGGGAQLSLVESMAKTTLKLPSKVVASDLKDNSRGSITESSWAVAYGLLMLSDSVSQESDGAAVGLFKKLKDLFNTSLQELIP